MTDPSDTMTTSQDTAQGSLTCTIDIAPNPVDAGADVTITASVVCDPACDLTGDMLSIRDADGAELATIEFTEFHEDTFTSSGSVTLSAPETVGDHSWTAVLAAFSADDLRFAETSLPIDFSVKPHATKVNVWDVPPAIGLGEGFSIKVGIKCMCGCDLSGLPFTVQDETGAERAAGVLGPDVLPATDALYFADVALTAPALTAPGLRKWDVRFSAEDLQPEHAGSAAQFGVTLVPAPEHTVTIEARDIASQTPLAGAIVAMHPYRTVTDGNGIAELRVPKGDYTIFVSARKYVSDKATVSVTEDIRTHAQLMIEVRPERL